MKLLANLLRDLEARGVRLQLNPAHGRLEFEPFEALDDEPDLLDALRQQRRALEADLWARQRPPKEQSSAVSEPGWTDDDEHEPW